jgi:hypothetical protein
LVLIRPRSPASFFELDWCAIKLAAQVCSFAKRRSAAKLINREVVYKMNEGIFIALRQTVLASGSRTLKNQNAQRNAARDPASARN